MGRNVLKFVVLGTACSAAVLAVTVGQTIAAPKKTKEPAPVVGANSAKHQSTQRHNPSIPRAQKSPAPAAVGHQSEAVQEMAKSVPAEVKRRGPKSHRRLGAHKKETPKAIVQPRIDLMHHGMLESPQRYEFRRNHLGTSVPDQQAPELTQTHFQELDRNQDGLIDPIERTFSRLDINRDFRDHRSR